MLRRRYHDAEGLGSSEKPHAIKKHSSMTRRCSATLNGVIMTARAYLDRNRKPQSRHPAGSNVLAVPPCACANDQAINRYAKGAGHEPREEIFLKTSDALVVTFGLPGIFVGSTVDGASSNQVDGWLASTATAASPPTPANANWGMGFTPLKRN
jgi:hypothetical protein